MGDPLNEQGETLAALRQVVEAAGPYLDGLPKRLVYDRAAEPMLAELGRPLPEQGAAGAGGLASGISTTVVAILEFLRQASVLLRVSWRLVLEPVALLVFVLGVALSLGSALLWAMLSRVALGGASES